MERLLTGKRDSGQKWLKDPQPRGEPFVYGSPTRYTPPPARADHSAYTPNNDTDLYPFKYSQGDIVKFKGSKFDFSYKITDKFRANGKKYMIQDEDGKQGLIRVNEEDLILVKTVQQVWAERKRQAP